MSALVNLLPDLRQAKLREVRRRQLAVGVSIVVWIVCAVSVLVLFLYSAAQRIAILSDRNTIEAGKKTLERTSGLTDALTAAQHLAALPGLYSNRVLITKFLAAYSASDPTDVSITTLKVDSANVLSVSGIGKSFASVAKLARSMEALNVSLGPNAAATNKPYFSKVTIGSTSNQVGKGVTFTLTATVSSEVLHAKQ
jgi:Tfp pilus assembly protein PilN